MSEEGFPFVQKRFFEEYLAWAAVERITDTSRMIEAIPEVKQLIAAKSMEPSTPKQQATAIPKPKAVPSRMTEAQLRDRREMLKQQAELLLSKK